MAAARTSLDLSAAAMRRASRSDFVDDPTVAWLHSRRWCHSVRTSDRRVNASRRLITRRGGLTGKAVVLSRLFQLRRFAGAAGPIEQPRGDERLADTLDLLLRELDE